MKIDVSTNFADVITSIRDIGKQAKYAAAVALTKTAQEVQTNIKQEMTRAFDRPTDYTINSVFIKPATKDKLVAKVGLKNDAYKGVPADRYLAPQIFGGRRSLKSMEKALQSAGLMPSGHFAVPAAAAQMDQFGNVKTSQIIQVMSQLKVQRGGGFESRASNKAASKRTVAKQGVTYFAVPRQYRKLKPGIYEKRISGKGSSVKPVFIFVSMVKYQKRLRYFEVAEQTVTRKFASIYRNELKKALATAR